MSNDSPKSYASPPCFAHELTQADDGFGVVDPQAALDTARWRKATRAVMIDARLAVSVEERTKLAHDIGDMLDQVINPTAGHIISLYWPFRGELDLRGWMARAFARGAKIALPVVVKKHAPLIFREWTPDCEMTRGVWNIPIPATNAEITPNVVISPLVGFDPQCYRLGYGGGFYDRTLAAMAKKPLIIGVGHPVGALKTIFPQPHDIPMDMIITGADRVMERPY
ncbi:5-formyltetrahydrofolate cyclo-ligase [Amylibacter ulvae]|uniref:5-formyltetrahydrofolate cyclo-ligase n=2 Tax=Paramylibacter ulvae TaxID=1651968 RepID=A0ABQ3CTC8_9RHOB|nr:5-formyltetrahydrofolate cyclo-ligase [Amylibacter ulvae]